MHHRCLPRHILHIAPSPPQQENFLESFPLLALEAALYSNNNYNCRAAAHGDSYFRTALNTVLLILLGNVKLLLGHNSTGNFPTL